MPPRFPRYWKGSITGTNRAEVIARLRRDGDVLRGRAAVIDRVYAAIAVAVSGTLRENRAEIDVREFRGFRAGSVLGVTLPVTGKLTLEVNLDAGSAQGQWQTDIGTTGFCRLEAAKHGGFRLWSRIAAAHVCRWSRLGYMTLLVALALLDIVGQRPVSTAGLILLLIPGTYLFRFELTELIRLLGITKAFGVEFQQPIPQNVLQAIAIYLQEQVQEAVLFATLDLALAPLTKVMLVRLATLRDGADRAQFNASAAQVGISPEHLDATWNALLMGHVAELAQDRLRITAVGQRYLAHLGIPAQIR